MKLEDLSYVDGGISCLFYILTIPEYQDLKQNEKERKNCDGD